MNLSVKRVSEIVKNASVNGVIRIQVYLYSCSIHCPVTRINSIATYNTLQRRLLNNQIACRLIRVPEEDTHSWHC
jgi:hypothetical protein